MKVSLEFFFFFFLSRAAHVSYGNSRARGRIGAAAVAYTTAIQDQRHICDLL